jgi:hypothetical protein
MLDWLRACASHYKKRGGGEAAAILNYLEDHQAEVLPYDINGRNDYFIRMKFFEKEQHSTGHAAAISKKRLLSPPQFIYTSY